MTTVLVINTISSVGEFHWILWDQPFLAFFVGKEMYPNNPCWSKVEGLTCNFESPGTNLTMQCKIDKAVELGIGLVAIFQESQFCTYRIYLPITTHSPLPPSNAHRLLWIELTWKNEDSVFDVHLGNWPPIIHLHAKETQKKDYLLVVHIWFQYSKLRRNGTISI